MENFFLCYECGATFCAKNLFDEHVLVHQAVSLCYQLYEFDKLEASSNKTKEEGQHLSSSQEINSKSQTTKSLAPIRKAVPHSVNKKGPKRKIADISGSTDSSYYKVPYSKQRKISHSDSRVSVVNKALDNVNDTITSVINASQADTKVDITEGKANDSGKPSQPSKTDELEATFTTSTEAISKMTVASTSALTASLLQNTRQIGTAPPTSTTVQKCLICDYRSSQGTDMVEHGMFILVRVHKTSIINLERIDYIDGQWKEKVKIEPRQQCAYCVRTFRDMTDYYLHVITHHKGNLLLPGVSKYNCIVYLAHPGMPTQMVRIFMKRP